MLKAFYLLVIFLIIGNAYAQEMTVEEYIHTYKDIAIQEMKRLGIPASITLAQGILETEYGNSELVKKSNNHFGIKCKSTWKGESVKHTDDAPNECFRKYATAEDSYRDHSDYLYSSPRYESLFWLDPSDYKGWAYGLKKAGYATNPRYPQILINNIEKYNLQQYNSSPGSETSLGNGERAVVVVPDPPKKVVDQTKTTSTEISIQNEPNIFKKTFSKRKNNSNQYFNRLRAVMGFKGKSLLAIATENDISLSKLLDYNDLSDDGLLMEDQWIYLEKKRKEGNRDTYTAIQNETLHKISQNNAVQLIMLAEYNNLDETSKVKVGTIIKLRPSVERNSSSDATTGKK